jgi:hypothetical protein
MAGKVQDLYSYSFSDFKTTSLLHAKLLGLVYLASCFNNFKIVEERVIGDILLCKKARRIGNQKKCARLEDSLFVIFIGHY